MPTLSVARPVRWTGIGLVLVLGLLGLHPPHYFAETATPADYARYPGPVLVAVMIVAVLAAAGIGRDRRIGWDLGIAVAVATWVLYVVQETVGLPGLSRNWWEPGRLLTLLLAAGFVLLARRQRARHGQP